MFGKRNGAKVLLGLVLCLTMLFGAAALAMEGPDVPVVLPAEGGTLSSGSYILNGDVTLTNNITIQGEVTIDLNGHVLKGTGSGSVITVPQSAKLTLADNNPTEKHYFTAGSDNLWTLNTTVTSGTPFANLTARPAANTVIEVTGGCITGGSTTSNDKAGGVQVSGIVMVNGGNIVGNKTTYRGGGVYVSSSGTFTLNNGGHIIGNIATATGFSTGGGGAVCVNGGRLEMNGGSMAFNYTAYGGGAVMILNISGGSFAMSGGKIAYNKAGTTSDSNGGGVCTNRPFSMSGGRIEYNETGANGGGVRVTGNGSFTMTGGSIIGNTATKYGGGVNNAGTLTVSGTATIRDNKGTAGGAVYTSGKFTMTDGTLEGNTASAGNGGGVCIDGSNAAFTMTDGEIRYNTATMNGGGVRITGSGKFTMNGGKITGNSASSSYTGGGVNFNTGTFTLGGTAQITGNVLGGTVSKNGDGYTLTGGTTQNVYLTTGRTVAIATGNDTPASTMKAGVTTATAPAVGAPVPVTGTNSDDYSNRFTSDDVKYKAVNDSSTVKLMLAGTITNATPEAVKNINHGYITVDKETALPNETVTVTAVVPNDGYELESLVYNDGTDHDITTAKSFRMPGANVTVKATFKQMNVAKPAAAPAAGLYTAAQTVTLSTTTEGATIYYTTDGTEPTTSSTKYTGVITVDKSMTIKAIAVKENWINSEMMTAAYTITGTVATPVANPAVGTYTTAQTVTLSTTTEGADIYYTTDGTEPTTSSTRYTAAISVAENTVIKAIAIIDNWTASDVLEASYTINYPVTKVEVSPDTMTMKPGESRKITIILTPENATDKSLTASMDQEGIVTIAEDGTITALKNGTVKVTFTAGNGVTGSCVITVKADPIQYKIIRGADQTVFTNADRAVFASDADFSKFDHVEVDGKTVAKKYYTAESGSTVITFNKEFIKTLSVGKHTMTIVSKDGSAKTSFNVADPLPKTGDSSTPFLWLGMCMLAIFSVLTLRKKAYKN